MSAGGRGLFITVEGIDGAGKSSHLEWLADHLRAAGRQVLLTREPGGTALGERLREMLLTTPMAPQTELLLMAAARSEHLAQSIRPALARGWVVICDRFADSTYAYQGGGRGMDRAWILSLEAQVLEGLRPHRTYLFDLPAALAAERRAAARAADRFEAEDLAFFERVRQAYGERVEMDGGRFLVLDGKLTKEQLRWQIECDIKSL